MIINLFAQRRTSRGIIRRLIMRFDANTAEEAFNRIAKKVIRIKLRDDEIWECEFEESPQNCDKTTLKK